MTHTTSSICEQKKFFKIMKDTSLFQKIPYIGRLLISKYSIYICAFLSPMDAPLYSR